MLSMSRSGSLYIQGESFFHRLDGSVKLFLLLAWTGFIFLFLDARVFCVMTILGFFMVYLSRVPWRVIRPLVLFIIVFTIFNSLMTLIITPGYGSSLTGTRHVLFALGSYIVTWETVFYVLTLSLKYFSILPVTLLFIFTTNPGSFACSLSRLKIPYKTSYAVSIALRYIPVVADEVQHIIDAQESRGVAFRKGDAGIFKRMHNYTVVLLPLLVNSLNRIETVSNAMDLRGFGRKTYRTWYFYKKYSIADAMVLFVSVGLVLAGFWLQSFWSSGYWWILQ